MTQQEWIENMAIAYCKLAKTREVTKVMGFKITLGNERRVDHQLRSEKDRTFEVLVDYTDPSVEGESLGWLTCLHDFWVRDTDNDRPAFWYLMGPNGNPLPGIEGQYGSKAAALRAAEIWMKNFIERGRNEGLMRDIMRGTIKVDVSFDQPSGELKWEI